MTHNFFVSLTPRERGFRWTVTCERCNADLSGEFSELPLTVIKINNLHGLAAMNPDLLQRRLGELERARATTRMIAIDSTEEVDEIATWNLQRMIEKHANECGVEMMTPTVVE